MASFELTTLLFSSQYDDSSLLVKHVSTDCCFDLQSDTVILLVLVDEIQYKLQPLCHKQIPRRLYTNMIKVTQYFATGI